VIIDGGVGVIDVVFNAYKSMVSSTESDSDTRTKINKFIRCGIFFCGHSRG
jgi:hypothetical protein